MGVSKKKMPRGKMRKWFSSMQMGVTKSGYGVSINIDEDQMDWLWERCEGYRMSEPTLKRVNTGKDYTRGNLVLIDKHIVREKYQELGKIPLTSEQKNKMMQDFIAKYRTKVLKKTLKK